MTHPDCLLEACFLGDASPSHDSPTHPLDEAEVTNIQWTFVRGCAQVLSWLLRVSSVVVEPWFVSWLCLGCALLRVGSFVGVSCVCLGGVLVVS